MDAVEYLFQVANVVLSSKVLAVLDDGVFELKGCLARAVHLTHTLLSLPCHVIPQNRCINGIPGGWYPFMVPLLIGSDFGCLVGRVQRLGSRVGIANLSDAVLFEVKLFLLWMNGVDGCSG